MTKNSAGLPRKKETAENMRTEHICIYAFLSPVYRFEEVAAQKGRS